MVQYLEYRDPDEADYRYEVLVKQTDGQHLCRLIEYKQEKSKLSDVAEAFKSSKREALYYTPVNYVDFDISTALGDFLNIYTETGYSDTWREHPFFLNHATALRKFNTNPTPEIEYLSRMRPPIPFFCDDLNRLFSTSTASKTFTIDEFEVIKAYFGVQINYDIEYWSDEAARFAIEESPIPYEQVPEINKFHVGYRRFAYGLNKIGDIETLSKKERLYRYSCHSLAEILFSVWHYCVIGGFKFVRCQHCGRLFSTPSLKDKYCCRNSTYSGYEAFQCETAVRRIKKKLKDRKTSIYNNWIVKYGSDSREVMDFLNGCSSFMDRIKGRASTDNLKVYELFLYSDDKPGDGRKARRSNGNS